MLAVRRGRGGRRTLARSRVRYESEYGPARRDRSRPWREPSGFDSAISSVALRAPYGKEPASRLASSPLLIRRASRSSLRGTGLATRQLAAPHPSRFALLTERNRPRDSPTRRSLHVTIRARYGSELDSPLAGAWL